MINTDKGVTLMINHLDCEYSSLTQHWNCCTAYITIDESDCDCFEPHDH